MARKKSKSKAAAKTAKAVQRETKRAVSNIRKNVAATGKFIRAVTGKKAQPKKDTRKSPKEPKQQTKPAKKSPTKSSSKRTPVPNKDSYKLRELASGKNLAAMFADLERNADEIDKLKPTGARWAFRIFDRQSLAVYRSMHQVVHRLEASGGLYDVRGIQNNINFITIAGSPADYQEKRQMERKELDQLNAETLSEARKTVGGSKDKRPKTKNELIRDLLDTRKKDKAEAAKAKREADKRARAAEKREKETSKRLAAIEKRIAKLLKDAEKKAKTKKLSTKKPSSKRSVSTTRSKPASGKNKAKKPAKKGKKK